MTAPSEWQQRIAGEWHGRSSLFDADGTWRGYEDIRRSSVFEDGVTTYYMDGGLEGGGPLAGRFRLVAPFAFGVVDSDADRIYRANYATVHFTDVVKVTGREFMLDATPGMGAGTVLAVAYRIHGGATLSGVLHGSLTCRTSCTAPAACSATTELCLLPAAEPRPEGGSHPGPPMLAPLARPAP